MFHRNTRDKPESFITYLCIVAHFTSSGRSEVNISVATSADAKVMNQRKPQEGFWHKSYNQNNKPMGERERGLPQGNEGVVW